MFEPGCRIGVAVSGGADSVCLLHVLSELAAGWDLRLTVLHFNHRLRGDDSEADAQFVAELAGRLGLPLRVGSAEVRRLAQRSRDNLEQAARKARREFLLRQLAGGELDRVALGHTRSDQAETLLLRLLRGSGTTGLAAMRPVTPEGFVRPLIEVGRADVERYLEQHGLSWRLDVSNLDLRLARNRIRHELLPRLVREWNPALEQVLAQTAALAREEEDYWAAEIERLCDPHLERENGAVVVRASSLTGLPPAAARRLVRRAIQSVKGHLRGVTFRHIEGVLELAASRRGSGGLQLPGLRVIRSLDRLRLETPSAAGAPAYQIEVGIPGRYHIPGEDFQVCLEISQGGVWDPSVSENRLAEGAGLLDWGKVAGELVLRNWRPADRYRPVGHAGSVKLKDLFQRAGIPLWERAKWPIMTRGREIVWARRFGPAAEFAPASAGGPVLVVFERPADGEKLKSPPPAPTSNL